MKQETVSGNGVSWAICKSAPRSRQTTTPLSFLQAGCPSCRPTNSVKALKPYAKTLRKPQKSTNVKSLTKIVWFSSFRNLTGSATVCMWSGRAFQVAGPTCETPARRTSCAAMVQSSPLMTWKMSIARNVICWRWLTGLFPSDTPGCDHSGWHGRGSTAWTLFCSWQAANAAGSGSAWHGWSDSGRTPVGQLHSYFLLCKILNACQN